MQTVKGMFLLNDFDKVREAKGEEGVKQLREMLGNIDIKTYKDYPIELSVTSLKGVALIQYGQESDEIYEKIGRWDTRYFLESPIGKVMASLFMNNMAQAADSLEKVIEVCYRGIVVKKSKLGENKIMIILEKCPLNPYYLLGLFSEGISLTNNKAQIVLDKTGPQNCSFRLSW